MICNPSKITINVHSDEFLKLVDLYWAEAMHYYKEGVLPILSEAADAEAKVMRQVHRTENGEEGALIDYLNMPVPDDWYTQSTFEHKTYWNNSRSLWHGKPRNAVCTAEVAREFFEYERKDYTAHVGRRVAEAIRRTGLFEQTSQKKNFGSYGSALVWKRIEKTKK
jgi:predicted P-loop ATPase